MGRMNSRRPRVPRHGMYPRAGSAAPVRCSVRTAGEQPDHPVTPIDPVYGFGEAGAPITLYRGPLVVGSGKPADGHIWLRLSGELEVLWEADKRCALGPTTLEFSYPCIGEVTIPAVVTSSNVDFHAANLVFWSGELEAEAASLPPGDDGVCAEVGLAQDG